MEIKNMLNKIIFTLLFFHFFLASLGLPLRTNSGQKYTPLVKDNNLNTTVSDCYTLYANIEVDYDFYSSKGFDKEAIEKELRAIMEMSSELYRKMFGIRFVVRSFKIFDTPSSDPYFGIYDENGQALLDKMKQIHDTHSNASEYDFVALYTAKKFKDVGGGTLKINGMFVRDAAYFFLSDIDAYKNAHEIGHLLGATHCDAQCIGVTDYDSNCIGALYEKNTLMCHESPGNTFSPTEFSVFNKNINTYFTPGVVRERTINGDLALSNQSAGSFLEIGNSTVTVKNNDILLTAGWSVRLLPGTKRVVKSNSTHAAKVLIDLTINECEDVASIAQGRLAQLSGEPHEEKSEQELLLVPNPSSGDAVLLYWLESDSHVNIVVTNAMGQEIKEVSAMAIQLKGPHTVNINMLGYSSGMYAVRFVSEGEIKIMKMLIE